MLIKKQYYQNNLEKSYTERKTKDEPSGYSLSLICSFDATKTRHYLYRGKDCVENFCKKLKELGTEIINYKEKEMMPLADKENKFYKKQEKENKYKKKKKKVMYAKKSFVQIKIMKMNLNTKKSEIIFITLENLEELQFKI